MAGNLEGKVAFITGAARGQGRSHAVTLARRGADIIAVDLCKQVDTVRYPLATPDDLTRTVELVEEIGGRIVATQADVRDFGALQAALNQGVDEFGRLDVVSANAGILSFGRLEELDEVTWQDVIDINLTGVWHTVKAAIPHLRAAGGGSIILTSSAGGVRAMENIGHYSAAKHGLIGMMRTLAKELASDMVRVNIVLPTAVDTDMIHNNFTYELFAPDLSEAERTREVLESRFAGDNLLPIPWVDAADISNAIAWLASDEARYVTGVLLPVDGGLLAK